MKKLIYSIDIETFGKEDLVAYCCCVIYKNRVMVCYGIKCVEKMIKILFKICENDSIFYAHNLTFDGSLIIANLPLNYNISKIHTSIIRGSIYSLCVQHNELKLIFRCSYRILPLKLSEISKKLNIIEKLEIDHNLIDLNNYNNSFIKEKVIVYCKRDTEIVQLFMSQIDFSLKDSCPNWRYFSYSIAGIALRVFKYNFKNIHTILKTEISVDNIIRPAYYGGRCEVFGNPEPDDHIFHYDFSGMYTNRLTEKYPCGRYHLETNIKCIEKPGFYSVTVESENFDVPILPYRCEKTNKLLFPNGTFSGVYWYEELCLFLENGGKVLRYHWAILYEKEEPIFEKFANYCKELRVKSSINSILWKMIPNSFIGRMGLRPDYEKTLILSNYDYDPRKYNVISDKRINDTWIVRIKTSLIDNKPTVTSNVLYAAVTTAKARILWWRSAQDVIKNGGRLLYCDTDSIFVSFKRDVSNEKHGIIHWDISKKDTIIDRACFATSKAYSIIIKNTNETKIKGVPKNSISFEKFSEDFYNKKNITISINFFAKNETKFIDMTKSIILYNYSKRTFDETKKYTAPLRIEDTLYNE